MTHRINPTTSELQKQIIMGTILGGSSIVKPKRGKNCYLSMRGRDMYWLRYKSGLLENLASLEPITIEKTNRWHSMCYPIFNEYYKVFYDADNNRNMNIESLNSLRPIGLAVWFGDCGMVKSEKVLLNTHIWGEAGTELIIEYFTYLDIKAVIHKERGNYRAKLDESSTIKFLNWIIPDLPAFFQLNMPTKMVRNFLPQKKL